MGITGLLPLLKKASKNCHIRKFSGCTAAIDAYCWLHKGAFGCAEKLGKGEPTDAYITYCMKYIQVLLDNKIKPIVVLDGRNLPSKEHTEKKRRQKRDENRKLARKYLQEGKRKEAWECFTRCVDITPTMAREFIKRLRSMKIDYVVAPYEADAQLAYLAKTGIVDLVITEDSDLVLFGCPRIFFKMNVNGDGVCFEETKLAQCMGVTPKKFNFEHFRWMCILSGCDYLPSLPGIGLGRAKQVIYASEHSDIKEMLLSIPSVLDKKVQVEVTDEYIAGFIQAENTFLYQLVFDTRTRTVIPLQPYPDSIDPNELKFAGKYESKELALGLALGNVDLHSLSTVDNFDPMKSGYPSTSIWSPSFTITSRTISSSSTSTMIGMQISIPKKVSSNKKRPFSAVNIVNETMAGDKELMELYAEKSTDEKEYSSHDSDSELGNNTKPESPSVSKRRRITKLEVVNVSVVSPSRRATRSNSRNLPFLKSPPTKSEEVEVHVKSKYFREATVKISEKDKAVADHSFRNKGLLVNNLDADDDSDTQQDVSSQSQGLSIYSYQSSSQASETTDYAASSQSSFLLTQSQKSITDEKCDAFLEGKKKDELDSGISGECSSGYGTPETRSTITDKKDDYLENVITLDDDDDEAYESLGISSITKSFKSSSITKEGSSYTESPYFATPSPSVGKTKPTTPSGTFRRQGLSRNAKKKPDPKQRSVKDMFAKRSVN